MLLPIETAIITLYWRLLSLYLTRQLLWFHPDSYYDFIQTAIMISSRLLLWFHPDCYNDFIQTVIMISSRQVLYLYTDNYCTFTYPYMLWLHPDRCYDFIQITVVSFRDDDARQSPVRPVLRSLLEPHGRLRQKVRQDPEEGKRLGSELGIGSWRNRVTEKRRWSGQLGRWTGQISVFVLFRLFRTLICVRFCSAPLVWPDWNINCSIFSHKPPRKFAQKHQKITKVCIK